LHALPESKVGRRSAPACPIPEGVAATYSTVIASLGADFGGWTDPAILRLDEQAVRGITALLEHVEPQLAGNGQLAELGDWGAKLVGAITRVAGLLHLAEHGESGHRLPVTLDGLRCTQRIGAYFKHCAIAAFDRMTIDKAIQDAVYLLSVIPTVATFETVPTQ
jgi:hypothetical protein